MIKDAPDKPRNPNLISVNFRLSPAQVHQLVTLGVIYGNRTRAFGVALDRLYQSELATNPAFAELVADGRETAEVEGNAEQGGHGALPVSD